MTADPRQRPIGPVQQTAQWLRFRLLPAVLRRAPRPVWRWPAMALAMARLAVDSEARGVAEHALPALGRRPTRVRRWRFSWRLFLQHETDVLLGLQAPRLTRAWAGRRVARVGALPEGGAILITPHHANMHIGFLKLSTLAPRLGFVASTPAGGIEGSRPEQIMYRQVRHLYARAFGPRLLLPVEVRRRGLPMLAAGEYLIIAPEAYDAPSHRWPPGSLLGHAVPLAPGPVWLARRSGRPIVPFLTLPAGPGWVLWIGAPIAPTHQAVAAALDACIRRSPPSWGLGWWLDWLQAPALAPRGGALPPECRTDPAAPGVVERT